MTSPRSGRAPAHSAAALAGVSTYPLASRKSKVALVGLRAGRTARATRCVTFSRSAAAHPRRADAARSSWPTILRARARGEADPVGPGRPRASRSASRPWSDRPHGARLRHRPRLERRRHRPRLRAGGRGPDLRGRRRQAWAAAPSAWRARRARRSTAPSRGRPDGLGLGASLGRYLTRAPAQAPRG